MEDEIILWKELQSKGWKVAPCDRDDALSVELTFGKSDRDCGARVMTDIII